MDRYMQGSHGGLHRQRPKHIGLGRRRIATAFNISGCARWSHLSNQWEQKKELPLVLSKPLDDETVRNLSRNGVELIIEERQIITQRSRTHGIGSIVSYLRWLKSNEARLSKDARLWQKDDGLFLGRSNASPLERFRIAAFQRGDNPELLVPVDKPQIQFAISGQKNN
ncbi:MAG: hypothetical protein AAF066_09665 [Pseudomonadota bacterium]